MIIMIIIDDDDDDDDSFPMIAIRIPSLSILLLLCIYSMRFDDQTR